MFDPTRIKRRQIEVDLTQNQYKQIRLKCKNQNKFFKKVYLTVTAGCKMLNHSYFGKPKEVMGLLQGTYYAENKNMGIFTVTDVIALPVQASQTRVHADQQSYNLIAAYSQWIEKIQTHNIVGWYHSHPSYGCWLSGTDVNTQNRFQMATDPFLAIVVDPIKSMNLQKLDIGAFRVYPNNYKDQNSLVQKDVPRRKAVDFGYHYQRYYQIPIQLYTNKTGQFTLKNIEKLQWATQISNLPFFNQLSYLTQQVKDQKQEIEDYLEMKELTTNYQQIQQKQQDTLKKVSYYAKQRNLQLMDTCVKNLLF